MFYDTQRFRSHFKAQNIRFAIKAFTFCFVLLLQQCIGTTSQEPEQLILKNKKVFEAFDVTNDSPDSTSPDLAILPDLNASSNYYGDGLNISIPGSGSHVSFAIHKTDNHKHCVGTDLNGIFCTQDSGQTYRNVSKGLKTRHVRSIAFDPNDSDTIYLGTNDGVYKTLNFGESWSLKTNGFLESAGRVQFPVGVVKVDPTNTNIIWAGFGGGEISNTEHDNTLILAEGCHPYSLYKSINGGETWEPKLTLMREFTPKFLGTDGVSSEDCPVLQGENSSAPETVSYVVNAIAINPYEKCSKSGGCQQVCAATDVGLYCSFDKGDRFYEVGTRNVKYSDDEGLRWRSCHKYPRLCRSEFVSSPSCTNSADCAVCTKNYSLNKTDLCLPLNSEKEIFETHPHILDVEFAQGNPNSKLYITLFEASNAKDNDQNIRLNCDYSNGSIAYDKNLDVYQGGLYVSEDYGATFQNLSLGDDGSSLASLMRCTENDRVGLTNNYSYLTVDSQDPEHVYVGGMNVYHNLFKGVFERYPLNDGGYGWRGINQAAFNNKTPTDMICYESEKSSSLFGVNYSNQNCYEGNSAEGIFGGTSTNVRFLESFTNENETSVFFGHQRGFHKASWDTNQNNYSIDFLNGSPESSAAIRWHGQVDNACPYEIYEYNEQSLMVIMADAGVILSDDGYNWEILRNINNYGQWSLSDFYMDDLRASVRDEETLTVYAHASYRKDSQSNSILKSIQKDYRDWTHIGGCYLNTDLKCSESTDYGLAGSTVIESLGIVYNSDPQNRKLIAGTDGKGLYLYDPSLNANRQWDEIDSGSCRDLEKTTISDIYTHPDHPNWALLAVSGKNNSSYNDDGIYLIDFTNPNSYDCSRLLNGSQTSCLKNNDGLFESCDPFNPTKIGITYNEEANQHYVVATGNHPDKIFAPFLYTSPLDKSEIENQLGSRRLNITMDWKISLDFFKSFRGAFQSTAAKKWWSYLDSVSAKHPDWQDEYSHQYFYNKSWSALSVSPTNPNVILAGMYAPTNFENNNPEHIYISTDGGLNFKVANMFEDLPFKSVQNITFSKDGQWIYVLGSCTSIYRFPNIY